jgi:hypothetical protein
MVTGSPTAHPELDAQRFEAALPQRRAATYILIQLVLRQGRDDASGNGTGSLLEVYFE